MKIRNSKKNIEISSPHLCKGAYNGKDVFLDEDFEELFYVEDGWKEAEEDKWHDLRKNPDDLPKTDEEKLFQIKGTKYPIRGYMIYGGKFVYNKDISITGYTIKIQKVIAWREIPKFWGE